MRYGICTGLENLELLERLGYDYIELSVTATMNLEPKALWEYREKLKSSKVKCEAFNILFPKTMELIGGNTSEEELREYLHKAMALIQSFGAEVVVFGSGKCRRCPKGMTYGEAYRQLVKVYRITGEIAGEYGVKVVIEPLSRKETNMICTMAEGAILESDVAHPNVGLLSDFFHVCANSDSIDDIGVIRNFGHIHIASGKGRRYPVSQEGECYGEFIKALQDAGYNGRISIEGKTEDMEKDGAAALVLLRELEGRSYE
ncbi:MAG: sugar phosphate isomerase/epimerase [Hungatella sp.]|jgi:sugar phosphate isomerase/epimerase|nr:sugar phosphate isomerase/epimerase [Hungatella sp.]